MIGLLYPLIKAHRCMYVICKMYVHIFSPSAGCSPPSSPVSGRVSEFTSSRVGAQVTYSCDTDLVLVGERVATCSEPSLQWLPGSDDIMCVPPPGIHECVYAHCCQVLRYTYYVHIHSVW